MTKATILSILLGAASLATHAQELSVSTKMDIASYLISPDVPKYTYLAPTTDKKGKLFLDYYCKRDYFGPFADTFNMLALRWTYFIYDWVSKDSLGQFDSIYISLYPYGDYKRSARNVGIRLRQTIYVTEYKRLNVLLAALPFDADTMYFDNDHDSICVSLHLLPGYSPPLSTLKQYQYFLGAAILDYVHHRRKLALLIRFVDDDLQKIYVFHIEDDALLTVLNIMSRHL